MSPARLSLLAVLLLASACGTTPAAVAPRTDRPTPVPWDERARAAGFFWKDDDLKDPDLERAARFERRLYPALVLPLKPAVDGDAADIERGLGVSEVLSRALALVTRDQYGETERDLLAGELFGMATFFGARDLFATSAERTSWVSDADPTRLPSKLATSRFRFVIGGHFAPAEPGRARRITLWLMDRKTRAMWSGTAALDLPRLQEPRYLLLKLLTDAGQAPKEVERGDMLWAEELDEHTLRVLGHTTIEAAWNDHERTEAAVRTLLTAAPWSWTAWIVAVGTNSAGGCGPVVRERLNRAFSINPKADFLAMSQALSCDIGALLESDAAAVFDGMQRAGAVNCAVGGKALAMIAGGREVPGSGFLAGLGGVYRGSSCAESFADIEGFAVRATDPFVRAGLFMDSGVLMIGEGDLDRGLRNLKDAQEALAQLATETSCLPRLYGAEIELHLGGIRMQKGQLDRVEAHAAKAQALGEACADRGVIGRSHNLRGLAAQAAGHYDRALPELERALALFVGLGDEMNIAVAKTNIGWTRVLLGQAASAIDELQEALALKRRVRSDGGVAVAMQSLGVAYMTLGEFAKAEPLLEEAIISTSDRASIAAIASNLARVRAGQGRNAEAMQLLARARAIAERIHARALSAQIGQMEGGLEAARGDLERAFEAFNEALVLRREVGDRAGEGLTLSSLMVVTARLGKTPLAIMYGKLAIDAHQELMAAAAGVDREAEKSFLATRAKTYEHLADILVQAGRLVEAERVLNLLKLDEAEDWTRAGTSASRGGIPLTPAELELEKVYRSIADQVMVVGREHGQLASKWPLTPEEETRLAELRKKLESVNAKFSQFLMSLADEPIANQSIDDLREAAGIGPDLAELPGTVAVYTLVLEGSIVLMVVSADTQVAETVNLPMNANLNGLVARFRESLQDPRADPRPMGKELYDLLVAPIAKHLDGAKAQTVIWSLDKALRYVPMNALWDGKRFLVERWQNALFTPASRARLKDVPRSPWRVLGAGMSKASEGFKALPGVVDELGKIVDDDTTRDVDGAVPGVALLDEGFVRDAFLAQLNRKWPVIHIASHFAFEPGDKDKSFLVLGEGRFSVSDLERLPNLFQNVDLLTLSACNTATGDDASEERTGREVESFAVLAQQKGARAVLATLWPVADGSTSALMQRFYALHQQGKVSKLAALRQAQRELLDGKLSAKGMGERGARPLVAPSEVVLMDPDRETPAPAVTDWRHPYYWAPFVLIGNTL